MENPAPKDATWQVSKVPPGSLQDRGMREEKRTDDCSSKGSALNSGDPFSHAPGNRRDIGSQLQGDADEGIRESDPPMVVRDGSAGHAAKGRAGKQRKQSTHHWTRILPDTVSSSLLAMGTGVWPPCAGAGSVCALS